MSSSANAIAGTVDDPLYRSDHHWSASVQPGYKFTVPNGIYQVTLKFAETQYTATGQRTFDVKLEGLTYLSRFDILAAAGGRNTAIDRTFQVTVNDGVLQIALIKVVGDPKINAIEVRSALSGPAATATATPVTIFTATPTATAGASLYLQRLNAGSNSDVTIGGAIWAADRAFDGSFGFMNGGTAGSSSNAISPASEAVLFQSDHWWPASARPGYKFVVPNGAYEVTLRFAETQYTAPGQRQFDIILEGVTVRPAFDIYAAAGGANKSVDTVTTVTVNDGVLQIAFGQVVGEPKVNAIQVKRIP